LALLFGSVVHEAWRGKVRVEALFCFGSQPSFHVLAQIVNVFLRHSEFDVHEDDIVIFASVALGRSQDFDTMLFDGPNDRTTVHWIARQTVEFPANDALGIASFKPLHHGIEYRAPRFLGGLRLYKDLGNGQIQFFCKLFQLVGLRFNRKNLPIFGFG